MSHGRIRGRPGNLAVSPPPPLTAPWSAVAFSHPSALAGDLTLPCGLAFHRAARGRSLPGPFQQEEEAEPSVRPRHLAGAQTPCGEVASHGRSEMSATGSPSRQEARTVTVLGDAQRDELSRCGFVKLRKIEAGGPFPRCPHESRAGRKEQPRLQGES